MTYTPSLQKDAIRLILALGDRENPKEPIRQYQLSDESGIGQEKLSRGRRLLIKDGKGVIESEKDGKEVYINLTAKGTFVYENYDRLRQILRPEE